jgi:hypothetical protein
MINKEKIFIISKNEIVICQNIKQLLQMWWHFLATGLHRLSGNI